MRLLRKFFKIGAVIALLTGMRLALAVVFPQDAHRKPGRLRVLFTNHHEAYSHGHLTFMASIVSSDLAKTYDFYLAAPATSDAYHVLQACENVRVFDCVFSAKLRALRRFINACKRFRKICKDIDPDIIHINGSADKTVVFFSTWLLPRKPKIIRTYHVSKTLRKDPYHRFVCNHWLDANHFVSRSAYALNLERGGLALEHLWIVENGVDTDYFAPMPEDKQLREKLGIAPQVRIFGTCAGVAAYKRVDLMVEAIKNLRERYPIAMVALGDEANSIAWRERIHEANLDDCIYFVGFHRDVRPYVSLFDIGFVLSDGVESCSYAACEMMSMGVPLIASTYSGLKNNVDNTVNGLCVPPDDAVAVQRAVENFANMSDLQLEAFSKAARLKVCKDFSVKAQIEGISAMYASILRGLDETRRL